MLINEYKEDLNSFLEDICRWTVVLYCVKTDGLLRTERGDIFIGLVGIKL